MENVSNEDILKEIRSITNDITGIRGDITGLKDDVADIKSDGYSFREYVTSKFKETDKKLDDVIAHSLDMKRTLNSHTEMISDLAIDLEEIKIHTKYTKENHLKSS